MIHQIWSAPNGPWKGGGVAIVGMAGRFPQADSVEAFWRNLLDGRDCIARFTRDELLAEGVPPAMIEQSRFVPAGAVLNDIELFDAEFFGISPREAESMDPQQRLFLEVVQHAFDDSGIDPSRSAGSVAVYAGCRLSGYWLRLMKLPEFMGTVGWHQVAAGNDKDYLPTQVSFRFDLRGPSVNVQAACSTSLLAVAQACDALVHGRCDLAVAGAASIAVPHRTGYVHQPSSIASSDGTCRPFDAAADGSVLGNAVAAVVLKRVNDAITTGDRIYAVIRAIAVNNDGKTKSSFASPSVQAQSDVIARAVAEAGVAPHELGYVEAHGTATALGDPIEVAALARVFGSDARRQSPLGIGSVKSNVGHLDPVAGLGALVKASLSLQQEIIPASLHFECPNPKIDFASAGVRVVAQREPWPRGDVRRYAGVSAFGIGGTNVHAILEEPPLPTPRQPTEGPKLLVVSAKNAEALHAMESELAACLRRPQPPVLDDVACTLALGRRQFNHRRFVVAESPEEAARALEGPSDDVQCFIKERPVVFLFPGQGGQRLRMGQALYRAEPLFRSTIQEVFELAGPLLGFDGRGMIDPQAHGNGGDRDVSQTEIAQPLLFAVGVACARLWMHWGVQPQRMLGHSIGELVAAHLAGVLTLPDAVRVVCARGKLMQAMPPGAMLAVSLDEQEALALQDADLRVAAFNAPRQQTISGGLEAIATLEDRLRERGVDFTRLGTSHAFHHPSMAEAAADLSEVLHRVQLAPPSRPFISCVTGQPITEDQATSADYWARSIVQPVRFSAGVRTLLDAPDTVFIECGAGRALGSLIQSHGLAADCLMLCTMSGQADSETEHHRAIKSLGQAWQAGVEVDWEALWRERPRQRAKLPGYAFQRRRFWVEAPDERDASIGAASAQAGLGQRAINCYTRTWTAAPKPPSERGLSGTWIVLADDAGLGSALAERLRSNALRTVAVHAGREARQLAEETFCVDPHSSKSIQKLINQLQLDVSEVHVVNAWTVAIPTGRLTAARGLTGALLGFWAPLSLLHELSAAGRRASSLLTLTGGLFPIRVGEWPEPAAASAVGLTRVLPQEVPGFDARLVDVLAPTNGDEARALVEKLVAELKVEAGTQPIIAFRSGARLVETFVPFDLPPFDTAKVAHAGGTYLITGGFGGIGGVLAKVLAQAGGVHLALIGRRGLGGDDSEYVNAARRLVGELESMGATVLCLAADVADPGQLKRAVGEVHSQFGRIDGVIHAAGVPAGRMLMGPRADYTGTALQSKVQGTVGILEAVAGDRPDFVLLCSSFAAVAGGVGQGEYSAANAFVDAAAWATRALGLRAIAVNWPAWRDVGMAHAMNLPPELEHLHRASRASGITPAEGAELFARIVAADMPQLVVAPFAAPAAEPSRSAAPAASQLTSSRITAAAEVSNGPVADASTEEILVTRIRTIWSAVLGVQTLRATDNFFELGGQSLLALQIVSRVGEQFGIEMNLTDVFENPTLERFGAIVHRRMVEHIASMPEQRVHELLAGR